MRQHRLADDVADSVYVGNVGFLLLVNGYKTAFIDHDAGILCADIIAIGAASDCKQYTVKGVGFGCAFAFEADLEAAL